MLTVIAINILVVVLKLYITYFSILFHFTFITASLGIKGVGGNGWNDAGKRFLIYEIQHSSNQDLKFCTLIIWILQLFIQWVKCNKTICSAVHTRMYIAAVWSNADQRLITILIYGTWLELFQTVRFYRLWITFSSPQVYSLKIITNLWRYHIPLIDSCQIKVEYNIPMSFDQSSHCFNQILMSKFLGIWRTNLTAGIHLFAFHFKRPENSVIKARW